MAVEVAFLCFYKVESPVYNVNIKLRKYYSLKHSCAFASSKWQKQRKIPVVLVCVPY